MAERIGVELAESRNRSANPRWWVLLAVVLALMALVTAASAHSGRSQAPATRESAPTPVPSTTSPPATAPVSPPPAVTTPTTVGTTTPLPSLAVAPPTDLPPPTVNSQVTAASEPVVVPPTTAPPSPSVASFASEPSSPAPTATYPGYLQYPDNVSAQYQVTATGALTVTATWSTTASLSLSVSCPGGSRAQTGSSGLSVSVSDPFGPGRSGSVSCGVELAEPSGEQTTISYSLAVHAGG